ncbi:hypothetical protein EBT31_20970 [bacterium]|nr:hypothetical protein [bacterium]
MDDAEFIRLSSARRMTAEEEQAWLVEVYRRAKEERDWKNAEKTKTKGRYRASEASQSSRRYTLHVDSRNGGAKPD